VLFEEVFGHEGEVYGEVACVVDFGLVLGEVAAVVGREGLGGEAVV
jgi:hypothetical protein